MTEHGGNEKGEKSGRRETRKGENQIGRKRRKGLGQNGGWGRKDDQRWRMRSKRNIKDVNNNKQTNKTNQKQNITKQTKRKDKRDSNWQKKNQFRK